jgi:hypothetical protein
MSPSSSLAAKVVVHGGETNKKTLVKKVNEKKKKSPVAQDVDASRALVLVVVIDVRLWWVAIHVVYLRGARDVSYLEPPSSSSGVVVGGSGIVVVVGGGDGDGVVWCGGSGARTSLTSASEKRWQWVPRLSKERVRKE